MKPASHPILSGAQAKAFEARYFGGDATAEGAAMEAAGAAVSGAVQRDYGERGPWPPAARILVLAGRGNNGGDALIAARHLLRAQPDARADVVFALGQRGLRPLAQQAWRELCHAGRDRVLAIPAERMAPRYDLSLDGIFGFQFHPPVSRPVGALLARVNALPVGLRAAIDLPSGLGDAPPAAGAAVFRADFTYATGSVKRAVVDPAATRWVGRLRYLDLGFFDRDPGVGASRVLTTGILAGLRALRASESDKRAYGHLFVVAGSRGYPGAALMSVLAALRSGAGLVTAAVPESLAPAFAARAPEAMWVGMPETPDGGLALEGWGLLQSRMGRASAIAMGSGLGREPETLALVREVVEAATVPLVIDADALQPAIVTAGRAPRILTPHAGDWARIKAGSGHGRQPRVWREAVVVHKAPLTAVAAGKSRYFSPFGGPVLARGGSGDVLTGLTGGLLAQTPADPLLAACRGVLWHGRAADALARAQGATSAVVTQLLEYLPQALREG
jgi:NAD(P)H-hydrate epimerase